MSSGGTAIIGLLASPLARGLFHKAWLASASPILNKTAADAFQDNMVFVNNTGCRNVSCLYALSAEDVVKSIPWDVFPYWRMADQNDLPEKGLFDGALPVIDGKIEKKIAADAICFLILKVPKKLHLKNDVCWSRLLQIIDYWLIQV